MPHNAAASRAEYTSTLSLEHRKILEGESGISDKAIAARGYRTAARRADVPDVFPEWQRRLGLVIPIYSPDGVTRSFQLKPRKPIRRKSGDGPKYEMPYGASVTLDVNPLMLEEVRYGTSELWVTEGCKKVDALASWGIPAVGGMGVYMFAVPVTKGTVPLPCWRYVRLKGRTVIIAFDADAKTNAVVQEALRRLVVMLEKLGAKVLVVYVPPVNGDGKAGVDDYKAAGGTVEELRLMASPYKPADIARERMSSDERLKALIEDLRRRFWDFEWKGMGGHSARDVYKELVDAAGRSGKPCENGVRVTISRRTLAELAQVSGRTLGKAIERLEEAGLAWRDNEGRKVEKAGAFVLRAKVAQVEERRGDEERGGETAERGYDPGVLHLRPPRLRWSAPQVKGRRSVVRGTRRVRRGPPPRDRAGVKRLGKIRGAVLDVLDEAGGSTTVAQICEVLHRSRPRDLKRRVLPMLEEERIIYVEGDVVTLAGDWFERLHQARVLGKETEAELRDQKRHQREREAFRRRRETAPDPHFTNMPGADGRIEDLRPAEKPADPQPEPDPVTPLATAVRAYLEANPRDACQPPGWIGSTLWAYELYPGKPTMAEIRAAIDELGGETYLREKLATAKGAA